MRLLQPDQYQAKAEAVFTAVASELAQLLPAARVEHIGASAVPGALSKGDVDVCVVVSPGELSTAVATLQESGYVPKQETLRTPELCMLVAPSEDIDLALQVIAEGSQFEFFIRFRDALRSEPDLVQEYNRIKLDSICLGENGYRDAKSCFIEAVLQRRV